MKVLCGEVLEFLFFFGFGVFLGGCFGFLEDEGGCE